MESPWSISILLVIKELLRRATASVMVDGTLIDPVDVERGVKQGDVPSPTHFNVIIDHLAMQSFDNSNSSLGIFISALGDYLTDREFADDNITVSDSE